MVDLNLNLYSTAIKSYNELDEILRNEGTGNYRGIEDKLRDCSIRIDFLISSEESDLFFSAALQQLKYQLKVLLEVVRAKIYQPNLSKDVKTSSSCEDFDDKAKNRKQNGNLTNLLESTEEIPQVGGLHDIVGLREIKKSLKSLIILPKTQPQLFEKRHPCNTILLYGPPGTGKTRLVHAVAAEAKAKLHCFYASEVLSHYVGESEKKIKALFQIHRESNDLMILFIDEIDGFCRKRNENEQEYTRRFKTELMCQLSNLVNSRNIIVISATNCPWDLDSAILRRFQKHIYMPLPNIAERLELFQYYTQHNSELNGTKNNWFPLLDITEGFSGSDVCSVIQNAHNIQLDELQDTKIWKTTQDGYYEPVLSPVGDPDRIVCSNLADLPPNTVKARTLTMSDLFESAENVKATVSPSDIGKYEEFKSVK